MCGELEEDGPTKYEEMLYTRFLAHANSILSGQTRQNSAQDSEIISTIEKLFTDALSRAVKDAENVHPDRQYSLLSMQPLVFARLAGFLAGHLSLQEDPLRKVMEAMMHGYGEAEEMDTRGGHDHGEGLHSH